MTPLDDLNNELQRAVDELKHMNPIEDLYEIQLKRVNQLVDLISKLEKNTKEETKLDKILANSAAMSVAGNLLVTVLLLNHERANIITSKVFTFIRPR